MKRYLSEFLATFFLLAIVVGSGIMGERLAQGNAAARCSQTRWRPARD